MVFLLDGMQQIANYIMNKKTKHIGTCIYIIQNIYTNQRLMLSVLSYAIHSKLATLLVTNAIVRYCWLWLCKQYAQE